MSSPVRERHIVALDGLRGVAILAVILCHSNMYFTGAFATGWGSGPLAVVFGTGWVGVDLFFVLSGYLITGILLDAKGRAGYLRNFYARRSLRILPLYFAYLFFIAVILPARPGILGMNPVSDAENLSLALYYYNFYIPFVSHSATMEIGHLWSLAVEEHFYLVWPFLVLLLSPRGLVRACAIGAVASLVLRIALAADGVWLPTLYYITPCRVDALLAGAFLAVVLREEAGRAWVRRWAKPVIVGSGTMLLGIIVGLREYRLIFDVPLINEQRIDTYAAMTVGVAALAAFFAGWLGLVLLAPAGSRLRRPLEARWLVTIGRYSYGIYVFHFVGIFGALSLSNVVPVLGAIFDGPDYFAKPVLAILAFAIAFPIAYLSYHLFEKRFLGLKRYFEYRAPTEKEIAVRTPAASEVLVSSPS